MSGQSTQDRIRELVGSLRPVRPIPRLRAAGVAAVGLWLAALAADRLLGGPGLRPWTDAAWSDPGYLAALAGLALVAAGITSAALASAVPGREAVLRLGLALGALGLLVALAGGLWGLGRDDAAFGRQALAACASCIRRSVQLGIASSLLACVFIVRAAVRGLATVTALALTGGIALGAMAVHTTCPSDSALHQLLAHTLAPVLGAALLMLPLAAVLRRWLGRSRAEQG